MVSPIARPVSRITPVKRPERAAGKTVRLLYLVPNFQNPTGLLLSLDKRTRLLEWAERRDILIIEDDPYGVLYFDDAATAAETRPIKATISPNETQRPGPSAPRTDSQAPASEGEHRPGSGDRLADAVPLE